MLALKVGEDVFQRLFLKPPRGVTAVTSQLFTRAVEHSGRVLHEDLSTFCHVVKSHDVADSERLNGVGEVRPPGFLQPVCRGQRSMRFTNRNPNRVIKGGEEARGMMIRSMAMKTLLTAPPIARMARPIARTMTVLITASPAMVSTSPRGSSNS